MNPKTCTVKPVEIIDYLDYKRGDNLPYGPVKALQMEKHLNSCVICARRIDRLMGMDSVEVFTDTADRGEWNQWLESSISKLRWNDRILPVRKGSKLEKALIKANANFADLKAEDNKNEDNSMVYISGHILKSLYRSEIFKKMMSMVTAVQLRDLSARKSVIGTIAGNHKCEPGVNVELILKVVMPYGEKLYPLADKLRTETRKFISDGLAIEVEKINIEIVDVTV